jgi:hypothetical protein
VKTIVTLAQARKAAPGLYRIEGAVGVTFRKTTDKEGTGAFNQRYWHNGVRRAMSLGLLARYKTLAEVQARSRKVLSARDESDDPLEARRAKKGEPQGRKAVTFRQKAEAVRDVYTPTLKHKYAAGNWFNPIKTHVFPIIGNLLINEIEPRHIAAVLAALDAAGIPKTGPRLRAHVAMIFDAAIANGDRDPLRGNPADARLMRAMRPGTSKSDDEHYRRVDLVDAPGKVQALQAARGVADGALMAASLEWLVVPDRDRLAA